MTKLNTKDKIYQSIINLTLEKSLEKLSVAEITRHASITRGSFYNHFTDLKVAIQSLEDEQLTQLNTILKGTRAIHGGNQNEKEFYKEVLLQIERNKNTYQQLLSNNGDPQFLNKLKNLIRPYLGIDRFERAKQNKMIPKDFAENYVFHSIIDSLIYWLEDSPETPVSVVVDVLFNTRRLTPLEVSGIN